MTNKQNNQSESKAVSAITFARSIGKQPQQVYGWMRTGAIPEDVIITNALTGQKMLDEAKALAWYETRPTRTGGTSNQATRMAQKPEAILEMMIGWFEQAGQKKVAADLKGVLDTMKQGADTAAQ